MAGRFMGENESSLWKNGVLYLEIMFVFGRTHSDQVCFRQLLGRFPPWLLLFCITSSMAVAECTSRPCIYVLTCESTVCSASESAQFQAALDDAWRGDTIILTADHVWVGQYGINKRPGSSGYLTIQSSALNLLPPGGVRVTPASAPNMPVIQGPNQAGNHAVITMAEGVSPASFIRLVGLEVRPDPNMNQTVDAGNDIFRIGADKATTLAQLVDTVDIDRCYIHGQFTGETRNAIVTNAKNFTLRNSYISEIKMVASETHAISTYNTPGPLIIDNNFLEAASIVMLLGGGLAAITDPMLVSGSITNNYFHKPLKWFSPNPDYTGIVYTNKNMLEWKVGQNWQVSGNVFDQNFKDNTNAQNDQAGHAIAFNIRMPCFSAACASWAKTGNIVFENNIVRHSLGVWSILGADSNFGNVGITSNITIRNNLFYDISNAWQNDNAYSKTYGRVVGGGRNIVIANNTTHTSDSDQAQDNSVAMALTGVDNPIIDGLVFKNNITPGAMYGWKGDSLGIGAATVNAVTSGTVDISNNTMPGWTDADWKCSGGRTCTGNVFLTKKEWDQNKMGLIDPASGNLSLSAASPLLSAGSNKTPLGADISRLPAIQGLSISATHQAAVMNWSVSEALKGTPACIVNVSQNRNIMSELGDWTPIPDTNPIDSFDSNLDVKAGSLRSDDGANRTFVIGQATGRADALKRLVPSTTYYYRVMCGADTREGSFQTTEAPFEEMRYFSFDLSAPDSQTVDAVVSYGDAASGAPKVFKTELGAIPFVGGRLPIRVFNVNWNPQYFQVVYRGKNGTPTGATWTFVLP